jgi:hypothetical protein
VLPAVQMAAAMPRRACLCVIPKVKEKFTIAHKKLATSLRPLHDKLSHRMPFCAFAFSAAWRCFSLNTCCEKHARGQQDRTNIYESRDAHLIALGVEFQVLASDRDLTATTAS